MYHTFSCKAVLFLYNAWIERGQSSYYFFSLHNMTLRVIILSSQYGQLKLPILSTLRVTYITCYRIWVLRKIKYQLKHSENDFSSEYYVSCYALESNSPWACMRHHVGQRWITSKSWFFSDTRDFQKKKVKPFLYKFKSSCYFYTTNMYVCLFVLRQYNYMYNNIKPIYISMCCMLFFWVTKKREATNYSRGVKSNHNFLFDL